MDQAKSECVEAVTVSLRGRSQNEVDGSDNSTTESRSSVSSAPSTPSPWPRPRSSSKRSGRKSYSTTKSKRSARKRSTKSLETAPQEKRKGSRKPKHEGPKCLTCEKYGRSCTGPQEGEEGYGQPGCSVCRQPNTTKGEKFRKCHWPEPEKEIFTYAEATAYYKLHKDESVARKKRTVRAPAKPKSTTSTANSSPALSSLDDQQPLPSFQAREYNVLPPPFARTTFPTPAPTQSNPNATVSPQQLVQQPRMFTRTIRRNSSGILTQALVETPPLQTVDNIPQFLPYGHGFVPVYPHNPYLAHSSRLQLYLPPAGMPVNMSAHEVANAQPRPHYPGLPPPNARVTIPKSAYAKPQKLDRSGTPCRKWQKQDSRVINVVGGHWKTSAWKPTDIEDEHEDEDDAQDNDVGSTMNTGPSSGLRHMYGLTLSSLEKTDRTARADSRIDDAFKTDMVSFLSQFPDKTPAQQQALKRKFADFVRDVSEKFEDEEDTDIPSIGVTSLASSTAHMPTPSTAATISDGETTHTAMDRLLIKNNKPARLSRGTPDVTSFCIDTSHDEPDNAQDAIRKMRSRTLSPGSSTSKSTTADSTIEEPNQEKKLNFGVDKGKDTQKDQIIKLTAPKDSMGVDNEDELFHESQVAEEPTG